MKERQWNRRIWSLIGVATFLIVCATVTISVGNTMGRYVSQGQAVATFTSRMAYAYVSEEEWSEDLTIRTQVSNYEQGSGSACEQDVTFCVRLYLKSFDDMPSDDAWDPRALGIVLKASADGVEYGAEYRAQLLRAVDASTYLGKASGEGWMYVFLDQNGNEITYTMPKGTQSDLYFDIAVDNQDFEIHAENLKLKIETVRTK